MTEAVERKSEDTVPEHVIWINPKHRLCAVFNTDVKSMLDTVKKNYVEAHGEISNELIQYVAGFAFMQLTQARFTEAGYSNALLQLTGEKCSSAGFSQAFVHMDERRGMILLDEIAIGLVNQACASFDSGIEKACLIFTKSVKKDSVMWQTKDSESDDIVRICCTEVWDTSDTPSTTTERLLPVSMDHFPVHKQKDLDKGSFVINRDRLKYHKDCCKEDS